MNAWRTMSSWMEEQELGDEAGQELLQLLAEAAPSLGLTSSASPSARRTSSRARSSETIALLRARLRAAVPMCTGAHRPHCASTHGAQLLEWAVAWMPPSDIFSCACSWRNDSFHRVYLLVT